MAFESNDCFSAADTLGYIVAAEDGLILSSGGKLERDERVAKLIANMVRIIEQSTAQTALLNNVITIQYDHHYYHVNWSPKKIVILLKSNTPSVSVEA
ncbi:ragulator complex protein LAMTOR4-like protein [Dinothrombium tinctorium]|uniref:Ragulator complex protein LAMTOR4-like protein n=1 Tax=Dinothrombium tinctorium TaxID=1965070 RepID=A0A3S3PHV3_9ACAR|nr:ragulator complex protein LAMTOR4-like protein [Dinothrombium tinctorium]RWS15565.1 ragulator complex protein LAMTOR4-like protein [Dinothrombium tinctorium]